LNTTGAPRRAQARLSGILPAADGKRPSLLQDDGDAGFLHRRVDASSRLETEDVSFHGRRVPFDGKPPDGCGKERTQQIFLRKAFNLLYFS
jgi:hypothetical protein